MVLFGIFSVLFGFFSVFFDIFSVFFGPGPFRSFSVFIATDLLCLQSWSFIIIFKSVTGRLTSKLIDPKNWDFILWFYSKLWSIYIPLYNPASELNKPNLVVVVVVVVEVVDVTMVT